MTCYAYAIGRGELAYIADMLCSLYAQLLHLRYVVQVACGDVQLVFMWGPVDRPLSCAARFARFVRELGEPGLVRCLADHAGAPGVMGELLRAVLTHLAL